MTDKENIKCVKKMVFKFYMTGYRSFRHIDNLTPWLDSILGEGMLPTKEYWIDALRYWDIAEIKREDGMYFDICRKYNIRCVDPDQYHAEVISSTKYALKKLKDEKKWQEDQANLPINSIE